MRFDNSKECIRKSIRLKNYNYSESGAYFLTICTQHKFCLFRNSLEGKMKLNAAGKMVEAEWHQLSSRFKGISLDEYIVMPNHFHGIILIPEQKKDKTKKYNLSDIIASFKSITTWKYIDGIKKYGWLPFDKKLWQRNYYEHIIRDDDSLNKIREYILYNLDNWKHDDLFQDQ